MNDAEKHILIIITDAQKRINQIEECIDEKYWDQIIYLFDVVLPKKVLKFITAQYKRKAILKKYLKKVNFNDKIVLGNYEHIYCRYIRSQFDFNQCIFIDDGIGSIRAHSDLEKIWVSNLNKPKHFINSLIFLEFKFKAIQIFTIFELRKSKYLFPIKHSFEFIKKNFIQSKGSSKDVFFLGQPLTEIKLISIDDYKNEVLKIKSYYEEKGLVFNYILHPGENKLNKEKLFENIIELKVPVEFHLMNENVLPKVVASFCSTAQFSLDILLGKTILLDIWKTKHFINNYNITNTLNLLEKTNQNINFRHL